MEKKLRLQLFDKEGRLVEDRLVSQDPEIYSGPKVQHEGLLRIEFTLNGKDDIEKAKKYLDQLVGILPLNEKKKKKEKVPDTPEFRKELLEEVMGIATDQDHLIKLLRERDFHFMMTDLLEAYEFPGLEINNKHRETYQWMLKRLKRAKNPKFDKYDPMLMFGIQMIPERNDRIVVYLDGLFTNGHIIKVPDKPKEVFKKTKMIKFPHYMNEEEREKFRFELRRYEEEPDRKLSKFFKRWKDSVENLPKHIKDRTE